MRAHAADWNGVAIECWDAKFHKPDHPRATAAVLNYEAWMEGFHASRRKFLWHTPEFRRELRAAVDHVLDGSGARSTLGVLRGLRARLAGAPRNLTLLKQTLATLDAEDRQRAGI